MANSAFDPLRHDPFAAVQPPVVAITLVHTDQPNAQWGSLQQPVPQGGQQQQQQQQQLVPHQAGDDTQDILLQFNNTNTHPPPRRRADSHASGVSSRSARSGSKNDVLNDMTIAPPPVRPRGDQDYTRSAFHAEAEASPVPPPDWDLIKHSGTCLARISMRTLLLKKWKHVFWIAYGNHTIIFFKSRNYFDNWSMDPNLSRRQREELVKLRVDFHNPNFSTRKETENITGFQASAVKVKHYKSSGLLHQFKLDKWTGEGPTINAAFGSETGENVSELYQIMSAMIRTSSYADITKYGRSDSHTGDDSSAYYSAADYSGGKSPSLAWTTVDLRFLDFFQLLANFLKCFLAFSTDDRSAYSGRSQFSHRSQNSVRSGVSTGSKNNYLLNRLKSQITELKN